MVGGCIYFEIFKRFLLIFLTFGFLLTLLAEDICVYALPEKGWGGHQIERG